ncbi:radical SAM protein [Chitinibacter tainanensis]|uniref:radical SAM protein n=1 Tax=Chitinibacter tainanensis TaxID=230667 RepID=UPI0023567701|nr:hypothetical protein [Chitinibacter tainanensis]
MQIPLKVIQSSGIVLRDDAKIESAPVSSDDFLKLAAGKRIFLLSVNLEGIGLSRRLSALGMKVAAFLDSRFAGQKRHGVDVIDPNQYFEMLDLNNDLLIICTKDRQWKRGFLERAANSGLQRYVNLFTPLDICRFFPTIEIEGKCNLQCKTCDMGLPSANKGRGHMSHALFTEVLSKMLTEIPLMNSLALYTWGEPLLNPDIAKIVRSCREHGVACEVSTNLDFHKYLDEFLLAEPDQIVAPCAGVGARYERGRTGGSWDNYLAGLYRIAEIKSKHNLDYNVRIMYHLYNDNLYEDLDYMLQLSKELGFSLIPIVAHIFPGQVYQYAVNRQEIPEVMRQASEHLIFSLDDQLAYCQTIKDSKCHIINAFPTVTWDAKVLHCCNMQRPLVGGGVDFRQTSLEDLIAMRNGSPFCTKCMNHGVHRFFDVNVKIDEESGDRRVVRL